MRFSNPQLYKSRLILCLFFAFISLQGCAQKKDPVVRINTGYIKGSNENNIFVFKGIPYAQPPVGELRFKAPQNAKNRVDTLSCQDFGAVAAQHGNGKDGFQGAEDCLTLNVYTPVLNKKSRLPVVVWVHGGGMTGGSGKGQNGHAFSDQDSVVTVTINYRLGIFGFLYMGDTDQELRSSGNNGLLDCIMALKWIKENISTLGGDPARVTVMGQSAGAKLISTLLLSPAAKGYFNQLILESGSVQCVRDSITAKSIRKRLMDTLNITDPSLLKGLSAAQLIAAQDKVCGGAQGTNYFGPVADGLVLHGDPYTYLRKNTAPKIRILAGTNTAESIMFMDADKRLYQPDEQVLKAWFGNNWSYVLNTYQKEASAGLQTLSKDGQMVSKDKRDSVTTAVLTQYMYQMHAYRLINLLADSGNPVWTYRFGYSKNHKGANHAQELKYVWSLPGTVYEDKVETKLAAEMHTAWVNFIKGKNPGKIAGAEWPIYQQKLPAVMKFDQVSGPLVLKKIFNDPLFPTAGFVLN